MISICAEHRPRADAGANATTTIRKLGTGEGFVRISVGIEDSGLPKRELTAAVAAVVYGSRHESRAQVPL